MTVTTPRKLKDNHIAKIKNKKHWEKNVGVIDY